MYALEEINVSIHLNLSQVVVALILGYTLNHLGVWAHANTRPFSPSRLPCKIETTHSACRPKAPRHMVLCFCLQLGTKLCTDHCSQARSCNLTESRK